MDERSVRIVVDSAADLKDQAQGVYTSVPLKIMTAEHEYIDDSHLDVQAMADTLSVYKGKSSTACPNVNDWLRAFGDAEEVYCVTLTSNLSGSYNAACIAGREYQQLYPKRRVHVVDSLSAGPHEWLIAKKLKDLVDKAFPFEEICAEINTYQKRTKLLFMLESMRNLANNGRVSPLVAKAAGLLGIRVVGKASDEGTLEPLDKCRGEKKALQVMVNRMRQLEHCGGKVHITHCFNENAAFQLRDLILHNFKTSEVTIEGCGGLCSFYAEKGGLLLGFEVG